MSSATASRPSVAADVLDRVTELAPGFRERVALTEAARTVPPESIEELRNAGVARLMVPVEFGGVGGSVRDVVDVASRVAAACPSTGWLAGLMADLPHILAQFPAPGQAAVWASGPDAVLASSVIPAGRAVKVPGGYRVSSRNPFTSGINNADWVFNGAMVASPDGTPEWRLFLVDKNHFSIDDVWQTTGMRGTGSNTAVIEDVFVPEEFSLSQAEARDGTGPGGVLYDDPKYSLPWVGYSILPFSATMLGAAQGAYDHARATLGSKLNPAGTRVADGQILQVQMGLLAAKISTARRLLHSIADRADSGAPYSLEQRSIGMRDNAFASILIAEAIDTLLEISGTGAFGVSSPVQQAWRDIHFAVAHVSVNKVDVLSRYGRIALGVPELPGGGGFF